MNTDTMTDNQYTAYIIITRLPLVLLATAFIALCALGPIAIAVLVGVL
jgi:hypothetical protein